MVSPEDANSRLATQSGSIFLYYTLAFATVFAFLGRPFGFFCFNLRCRIPSVWLYKYSLQVSAHRSPYDILSVAVRKVDYEKLTAPTSMFNGTVPVQVKAALTRKYVADVITAKQWTLWASTVWPGLGACAETSEQWSIERPTMASLVHEVAALQGSAKEENLKILLADFEELIGGDWVFNLCAAVNETSSQLMLAVATMLDHAHDKNITGSAVLLSPLAETMLRVFAGIRGLLDPTPGSIAHHTALDVSFLNPLSKGDECLKPNAFKSAGPLCRLFKTHDSWKEFRGAYQKFLGGETTRGAELGTFYKQLEVVHGKITAEITEDDLAGETAQDEAMAEAEMIFDALISRRVADLQAFRTGGLKRLDQLCGSILKAMWDLLKDNIADDDLGRIGKMRNMTKLLRNTELFQAMNEVLMNRVEVSSSTSRFLKPLVTYFSCFVPQVESGLRRAFFEFVACSFHGACNFKHRQIQRRPTFEPTAWFGIRVGSSSVRLVIS
jgi:hypothetical protein